ncbi:MAG: POTRA domain-containing protein, partial [Gemmatimonadaceae bacterium]
MQTIFRQWTKARTSVKVALIAALAMVAVFAPATSDAQADTTLLCSVPDSIAIRGAKRVPDGTIRSEITITPKQETSVSGIERAMRAVYALGQFEPGSPTIECDLSSVPGKVLMTFVVKERALLSDIRVQGVKALSERNVRDRIDLLIGRPLDPALVAKARARIDSLYQANGYYLAVVKPDTTMSSDGRIIMTFKIEEGHRLAISGIQLQGNKQVKANSIVGAMKIQPEGFFFFHKGEFDDDKFVGDLGERIPALYSRLGFVDMHVAKDTLIVDRERGKGLIQISVDEGPQYKVGSFEIAGNRRFSTDELRAFYPFDGEGPTLTARAKALIKRESNAPVGVFNQAKWNDALESLNKHYSNYGYLYVQTQPSVERTFAGPDSTPTVNLRWDISEGNPAIVNRIDISGNDYTSEECIRRQIYLPPGTPFNQDNLVQSWQNIRNMGFFEQDMPFPETRRIND